MMWAVLVEQNWLYAQLTKRITMLPYQFKLHLFILFYSVKTPLESLVDCLFLNESSVKFHTESIHVVVSYWHKLGFFFIIFNSKILYEFKCHHMLNSKFLENLS